MQTMDCHGVYCPLRSSADTMPLRIWLIGNKSPRAFAARGLAKTPWHNSPICIKRRATRWWRSSLRNCSRVRDRIPMPPSGIPRQRQNSGAPNGRAKRRKRRCGLAEVPWKLLQASPSKWMENSAWSRPNPLKKNKNRRSRRIPKRWNRRWRSPAKFKKLRSATQVVLQKGGKAAGGADAAEEKTAGEVQPQPKRGARRQAARQGREIQPNPRIPLWKLKLWTNPWPRE